MRFPPRVKYEILKKICLTINVQADCVFADRGIIANNPAERQPFLPFLTGKIGCPDRKGYGMNKRFFSLSSKVAHSES
jgi:hypothetical protein